MLVFLLLVVAIVESRYHEGFDGVDTNILLEHECDGTTSMNLEQEQNVEQLFDNIDQDKNDEISYDEAVEFMTPNLFEYKSLFGQFDSNANGILDTEEVISGFKTYVDLFDKVVPDIIRFSDDKIAEYLTNFLFNEIDIHDNTYIQEQQFIEFYVKQEWIQFVDHPDSLQIGLRQFKDNLFKSYAFKAFKNLKTGSKCITSIFNIKADSVHLLIRILAYNLGVDARRRRLLAGGCYDEYDMVYDLSSGLKYIKDLNIGDYVFDGQDYTKVYFKQRYQENRTVNMLEIKYGNPNQGNSIILSADHMIYKHSQKKPIISDDIQIGDILEGININKNSSDNNYTVYSVDLAKNRNPVHPITSSGKLVVNDIITSVFTKSVARGKRMHESAAIFRWISDNINETIAAKIMDFYYNTIYSKFIKPNDYIRELLIQSQTLSMMVILSVPTIIVVILFKTVKLNLLIFSKSYS